MKKTVLLIAGIIISMNLLFSQTATLQKGEKYYEIYSFEESIKRLEQITEKDTDVLRKLASSYFRIGRYLESAEYWALVVKNDDAVPEDLYQFAYVLAINELYPEAERWMKEYAKAEKDDRRAELYLANPGFYTLLMKDKGLFSIKNLDINSNHSDFGTAFYKDKIVYTSTRALPRPFMRIWNWNKLPYLDIYVADVDSTRQFVNIERFGSKFGSKFSSKFSSKYHDGPAAFNKNGDFMAFTRNNYDGKSSEGIVKLEIYTTEFIDNKWTKPVSLHFNNIEYSVGHPTLSEDGSMMIFASDMPGGFGGSDLYVTFRDSLNNWCNPINLGSTVNTEGNEMFPFIHPDGILFFASDGLPGLGGLDVFYTNANDVLSLSEPINLGAPVNTNADDFAFILNEMQTEGYFSSNRLTGKGDNIYAFYLHEPFVIQKIIKGTTFDTDKNILSDVEVELRDENNQLIAYKQSSEIGYFEFVIHADSHYTLLGNKERYSKAQNAVDATGRETNIISDLYLKRKLKIILYCLITDYETNEIIENVNVVLKNYAENTTEEFVTTSSGDFERILIDKELFDVISLSLTLEKEGYLTQTLVYNTVVDREGRYNLHEEMQVVMRPIDVGTDLAKIIDIQPIYFDLGKADIRPDAEIELSKIVEAMNENPRMVIELGAHTDCRGTAAFNLRLSDRRAKASADYIKGRITNPKRISGKGYGESQLVNHCECEGAKVVPCTEEEHQENRRTEFRIIKFE